jgi:hypothetical protein
MTITATHAFDFIYGRWDVHNRKLRDNTDPDCAEWVEFPATSEAFPLLDGMGHLDRIYAPAAPDGPPFEGMTLRLFDPSDQVWRIWWSSTRAPGRLDPPMVGGFDGGHGVFFGDDVVGDRPIRLRFDWHADPDAPRWEQSFSFDGGNSWVLNWVMTFAHPSRVAARPTI